MSRSSDQVVILFSCKLGVSDIPDQMKTDRNMSGPVHAKENAPPV